MKRTWENDNCEKIRACYTVYHLPVAAALWCGVPIDQVDEELRLAEPVCPSNALGRAILRHPFIRCLEPRLRALHQAIDSGELLACREDGKRDDGHVAYERRHVYGQDLKEWAKKIAPSERPGFLFDDIEREIHPGIDAESYRSLKAAHDAKELKLIAASERIRELEALKGEKEMENASLRRIVDQHISLKQDAMSLGVRSERTYNNIIAALLEIIHGEVSGVGRHSSIKNESALIDIIDSQFKGYDGLSKSTLARKLPEARKRLKEQ